jgi:FtsZ-binding cell division protein ZapB
MAPSATRRSIWRAALVWFVVLALGVALLQMGIEELSRRQRIEQTHDELAQLQRMLEQFRQRNGHYPSISSNAVLLRMLLGRMDAKVQIAEQSWYLTGARLFFRYSDPLRAGNEIVDPWGRPYVYIHVPARDERLEGYLLLSGGPDTKHSQTWRWVLGENGTAPEDSDNLWMRP